MVFPCDEMSPFSGEGPFRDQMIQYIREHFADFLGDDINLLDLPNGLDLIQAKYPIGAATREVAKVAVRHRESRVLEFSDVREAVLAS